jgi:hypothetical protein
MQFDGTPFANKKELSQGSRLSKVTHTTAMASHMSTLPTLDGSVLNSYARLIFNSRRPIIDFIS